MRPLLRLESCNRALGYPELQVDVAQELQALDTKLAGLKLNLAAQDTSNADANEHLRMRVYHVLKRINRLPGGITAEQSAERSKLLAAALALLDQLDALCVTPIVTPPDHTTIPEPQIFNSTRTTSTSSSRAQPVSKWQLKFSGDPRGMSVHSFLERVGELRVARGVSPQQLFESAIDLFDGKALLWYRSNRQRFSDWYH